VTARVQTLASAADDRGDLLGLNFAFIKMTEVATPGDVRRLAAVDVLVLAGWCGLAAGELEIVVRVLHRTFGSTHRLYLMTRHFVWLVPLIDLALFLAAGVLLALAVRRWPRRAGWLVPRMIIAGALLPALTLAGRGVYVEAWLLLALGVASRVVPMLERQPDRWRRRLAWTAPALLGLVLLQAGWLLGSDRLKRWREEGRPLPAAGSPNVLLIVLDTVRADHLSLYGYPRPTTPHLRRLARQGIRLDRVRAASPWTLASHANMFTGRWPHELAVEWTGPLRGDVPTLAEHLGSLGYATAGFVGNTFYGSYDSGLDRGFTHYEDYVLDGLNAARTAKAVDDSLKAIGEIGRSFEISGRTYQDLTRGERKDARVVNREFLDWLSRRREPGRPFFAFLNYLDAHSPYLLPPGISHVLDTVPMTEKDWQLLGLRWSDENRRRFPLPARRLARDAYDNCLAYLDARLGELFDDLQRRGVLDQTLVIVTADHGEGLGEHGLFDHGESLYRAEIRVPLLIVLPADRGRLPAPAVVDSLVSLRDIAATITGFVRPGTRSPFPGRSLLEFVPAGTTPPVIGPGTHHEDVDAVYSELASPNPADPNRGRSPAHRGPLISLAEGDLVYIRNENDGREELFNERDDPDERHDLARDGAMDPVLRRFRDRLQRVKAGTLAGGDTGAGPEVAATTSGP
jgi:arylsulfatase A-like enzyme